MPESDSSQGTARTAARSLRAARVPSPKPRSAAPVTNPGVGGLAAFLHRRQVSRSPMIVAPSAAPVVLNGYEVSCPRAMLTTTAIPVSTRSSVRFLIFNWAGLDHLDA